MRTNLAEMKEICLPAYNRERVVSALLNPEQYRGGEITSEEIAMYLAGAMEYTSIAIKTPTNPSIKKYRFISPDGNRVLDFVEDTEKLFEFYILLHNRIGRPSTEFGTVVGMREDERYGKTDTQEAYPVCTGNIVFPRTDKSVRAVIDNLITFGNPSVMVAIEGAI
ncbi:hypothetical protein M0R04_02540 [Candidatus Dojkabacteria bacterium]|jgi:hypothetical protein|nr:hypothetical protein [Candidatus Dojkabacteria bacterium]